MQTFLAKLNKSASSRHSGDPQFDNKLIHRELFIDISKRKVNNPGTIDRHQASMWLSGEERVASKAPTGQGSNSANLRQFHERVVLAALRRLGQASKADLARHANLTDNTVGLIVRDLQQQQLIRIDGRRSGARGQPATLLSIDGDGAHAIGVKIGRRSIDGVLVDFCGRVLRHRRLERDFPPPEQALALAADLVADLRCIVPAVHAGRLAGLGLAVPYNLGCWRNELDISSNAYEAWNEFDLAGRLKDVTGLPVFSENDGTAATIAELFQGHGREIDNFLYVFIGTAIGGGVALGGDYYRGPKGNAGDIGLMPVPRSRLAAASAPKGTHDVLLARASISLLIRHLRANAVPVENRAQLDAALETHPHLVDEWLEDSAEALVSPILSAVRVLDLEEVVLDADLPREIVDRLICKLGCQLAANAPEARDAPKLRRGMVGRTASAIGAAILPLHLNFSPTRDILLGVDAAPGPIRISS
jgi:predicted NBD/HSP70 family sugar kinase